MVSEIGKLTSQGDNAEPNFIEELLPHVRVGSRFVDALAPLVPGLEEQRRRVLIKAAKGKMSDCMSTLEGVDSANLSLDTVVELRDAWRAYKEYMDEDSCAIVTGNIPDCVENLLHFLKVFAEETEAMEHDVSTLCNNVAIELEEPHTHSGVDRGKGCEGKGSNQRVGRGLC